MRPIKFATCSSLIDGVGVEQTAGSVAAIALPVATLKAAGVQVIALRHREGCSSRRRKFGQRPIRYSQTGGIQVDSNGLTDALQGSVRRREFVTALFLVNQKCRKRTPAVCSKIAERYKRLNRPKQGAYRFGHA